jgi:glutamine---fructose-6-phosphate transaminase (isomerizing)
MQRFSSPRGASPESSLYREISDQPKAISDTLAGQREQVKAFSRFLLEHYLTRLDVVAFGSSNNAARIGSYFTGPLLLNVQEPNEYARCNRRTSPVSLFVSQSGGTLRVIEAAERARASGIKVAVLTNTPNSALSGMADFLILTRAEPEKAIAATGTMTSAVCTFYHIGATLRTGEMNALKSLPERLERYIQSLPSTNLGEIVRNVNDAGMFIYLGENEFKHVAAEARLKMCETAAVFAEYNSTSAYQHGYMAAFGAELGPVSKIKKAMFIFQQPGEELLAKPYENLADNGGKHKLVYAFRYTASNFTDNFLLLPESNRLEQVILSITASQVLAHEIALKNGFEPGTSGTLQKVVTN